MLENMDEMLNNNSDLFDLSESDLTIPEKLIFPKNELIEGIVLDCQALDKIGAIKMDVQLTSTEHSGKCHELFINKPKEKDGKINPRQKKNWVEFLLAFWTKESILNKTVDYSSPVGKRISYRAGEAKDYNGKTYQSYNQFKVQE